MKKYLFTIFTLFLISYSFAKAEIIENFDSYTPGNIDGQGGWSDWGSGTYLPLQVTIDGNFVSSPQSIKNGSGNRGSKMLNTSTTNQISFEIKGGVQMIALQNSSNQSRCYASISASSTPNYYVISYHNASTTENIYSSKEWNKFSMAYNNGYECSYQFNENGWRNFSNVISGSGNYGYLALMNITYIDNITDCPNCFYEEDEVQIIELPNWEGDIQVGSAVFETENKKRCKIGGTCEIKYQYPYDYIGKSVYMFRQNDIDLINIEENSWSSAVASTTFDEQLYLMGKFSPIQENTPQTLKYCYVIVDNNFIENIQCTTEIKWSNEDTTEELLEKMGISPYDISTACDDIASSTGELWDDIRWGFECAMNKTGYWLFHPQDSTYVKLEESTTGILNEFPINIYQVIFGQLSVGADIATSTFELPIYLGDMASTSTVIAWSNDDLNDFGDVWEKIYIFLQIIIYFTVIMYFVHYMTGNKNQDV